MGVLATAGADLLLDAMLGSNHGAGWPATVHVALSSTDPATAVTEPAGVSNNSTNWPAASGRQKLNGTAVTFPTATASWGVLTHYALYASTTLVAHGALADAVSVGVGDTPSFAVGSLTVTVT